MKVFKNTGPLLEPSAFDMKLKMGDMFYLSSLAEQGPIARKVIVLEIDGCVAVVDTWNYAERCWCGAPVPFDLRRVRYVCAATPAPDPVQASDKN